MEANLSVPLRSTSEHLQLAGKKALQGGAPAVLAMQVQVVSLMWLRTSLNYQYRHGGTLTHALSTLRRQGGVRRLYQGLLPALLQAPLARFGDTAANSGMLALLNSDQRTAALPLGLKTLAASAVAVCWRLGLMPLDTLKTMMQVEGAGAVRLLASKLHSAGPVVLFHGSAATAGASFLSHYPWFITYNVLDARLPAPSPTEETLLVRLSRSALIGFSACVVSDTISNALHVVKTSKQSWQTPVTYTTIVQEVVAKDGWLGLLGRGLKTKLLANGVQSIAFTVLWRFGQDWWSHDASSK